MRRLRWLTVGLGLAVIGLAAAWVGIAVSLQTHYLALFRETLGEVTLRTRLGFPGLDLASLEALNGVGPYTARAVAAIAFAQPVAAGLPEGVGVLLHDRQLGFGLYRMRGDSTRARL